MKHLIALCGVPGSGKTTWALSYVKDHPTFVRVSRDDIRAHLNETGWEWSHEREKHDVIPVRDELIRTAFAAGHSVIVDETNVTIKHIDQLRVLAAYGGASFEVKHFFTPLDVCIRRDAFRQHPVGEDHIRDMAERLNRMRIALSLALVS